MAAADTQAPRWTQCAPSAPDSREDALARLGCEAVSSVALEQLSQDTVVKLPPSGEP